MIEKNHLLVLILYVSVNITWLMSSAVKFHSSKQASAPNKRIEAESINFSVSVVQLSMMSDTIVIQGNEELYLLMTPSIFTEAMIRSAKGRFDTNSLRYGLLNSIPRIPAIILYKPQKGYNGRNQSSSK